MAEMFGIAAGAIGVVSLSIQLAESLQKVKSFYAAAKNAPTQIEELIEEIEIMQDILSDLESGSQSANMASSASMRRCMKVAQQATKNFVAFSGQLQTRVKKSKFRGGVKFALSRDDIKEMLDQLERTKSSLNLAYSLYQQATAEDRHAALVSAVSLSQGVAVGTAQNTVTLERRLFQVSRRSVCSGTRLFRLSTPEWISNTIWQFEMRRSIVGLNFMLRTYGVIPTDAPILRACMRGDAVEMQRLFDQGLASPFDISEFDGSLWDIASIYSQGDSLRLLSQYDAASDLSCGSAMWLLLLFYLNGSLDPSKEPGLGVGRRFREELIWLRDLYGDIVEDSIEHECWSSCHKQAMRLMLCPPEEADSIWFWQFFERSLPGLGTVLSEEYIKDVLSRYIPEHHGKKTPLQLSAVATGLNAFQFNPFQELYDNIRYLEVIIAATISSGAGLHEGDGYHTPLLLFLTTIVEQKHWANGFHASPRKLRRGLIVWLKIMQNAGVDLVAYGAEETRRFLAYRSLECPKPPTLYWQLPYPWIGHEVLHFTFSYGPTPEDWTIRQDHMVDEYVGDFWQMPGLLNENARPIPGAWINEC